MKLELTENELGAVLDSIYVRQFQIEDLAAFHGKENYEFYLNDLSSVKKKIKEYWGIDGQEDSGKDL